MTSPCSLCLEDLQAEEPDDRFLRCVALPGRQPGLRPAGEPDVEVLRRGRQLLAPFDKPVVLLDGDEVRVAARRFRVHIHGETTRIEPPKRLLGKAKAATTVMALGAEEMNSRFST